MDSVQHARIVIDYQMRSGADRKFMRHLEPARERGP